MPSFALAAIGRDRPGIVASIARVLYEHNCNVEDSSMTMLRGNFAVMMVLAAPEGTERDALDAALRPACEELGLTYSVREIDDTARVPEPTHAVTVYGADKPGILFRVTELLSDAGVNITDLNSRLVGLDEPVYAVILELELPSGLQASEIGGRLRAIGDEIGVDVVLNERETDVL